MDRAEMAPLACDIAALTAEERGRRQVLADHLHAATHEMRERADGYAFRYPAALLLTVTAFVALERRCCPFFRFTLDVEPNDGPLWLVITGHEDVKVFIATELGLAGSG